MNDKPQETQPKSRLKWVALGVVAFMVLGVVVSALVNVGAGGAGRYLHVVLDESLAERPGGGAAAFLADEPALALVELTAALRQAARDPQIPGVFLEIRHPVMGFAQLQELDAAMESVRAAGKKSIAYLESAGELSRGDGIYAAAALADRIVMAPPGEINLVGMRVEVPFLKGLFAKLHIDVFMEKRHAYKNSADTFIQDRFTPEHREAITALVDRLHHALVAFISKRRHLDPAAVTAWMAQAPVPGELAKSLGMIDELAYRDIVIEELRSATGKDEPLMAVADYSLASAGGTPMALIIAQGPIAGGESRDGWDGGTIGSATLCAALAEARRQAVRGVLLRIDSPGGAYVASDLIRREIEVTRSAGIPVVVSMGNVAASGGYLIAMQADYIVAQPTTITGSIGVFGGRLAMRNFFQTWLGITFDSYETTPTAGMFSSLDMPTPAQRRSLNGTLDRIYGEFVAKAAKARGTSVDVLEPVARGRVWSGIDAHERGLVDALGGYEVAIAKLRELAGLAPDAPVSFQILPEPKSGFAALVDLLRAQARAAQNVGAAVGEAQTLWQGSDGLVAVPWHLEL